MNLECTTLENYRSGTLYSESLNFNSEYTELEIEFANYDPSREITVYAEIFSTLYEDVYGLNFDKEVKSKFEYVMKQTMKDGRLNLKVKKGAYYARFFIDYKQVKPMQFTIHSAKTIDFGFDEIYTSPRAGKDIFSLTYSIAATKVSRMESENSADTYCSVKDNHFNTEEKCPKLNLKNVDKLKIEISPEEVKVDTGATLAPTLLGFFLIMPFVNVIPNLLPVFIPNLYFGFKGYTQKLNAKIQLITKQKHITFTSKLISNRNNKKRL